MTNQIKRIGVLTSGGDCAGLNAVIRAVVYRATLHYGWEVYGIIDGTDGLAYRPVRYKKLSIEDFSNPWLRLGGTMLGTVNSGVPFNAKMIKDFSDATKELGIDAFVVIGGDGSMSMVSRLCRDAGVKMVGAPKTIDNDTPITEHSVGFSTARDVCVEALDRLNATASSHHRVMILEVMGRDAGHIALHSAIAGGADVCLLPEIPYTLDGVISKLKQVHEQGRSHALVVVAEGVKTPEGTSVQVAHASDDVRYGGIGQYLSARINKECDDFQTRVTVLGHIQRGGTPSSYDRLMATVFGSKAVDLIAEGRTDRMVAWKDGKLIDVALEEVTGVGTKHVNPDDDLVKAARDVCIYVGEGVK